MDHLPADVLLEVAGFLSQSSLIRLGQTCRSLHRIRRTSKSLLTYTVKNTVQGYYASLQNNLMAVYIRNLLFLERYFISLPAYLFLGHGSSFTSDGTIHSNVKILFIDHASIELEWDIFPNLEELFISTSDNVNIDTLDRCKMLRTVVISIDHGFVGVSNPNIFLLPCLEKFAVCGAMVAGKEILKVTQSLSLYIFFTVPREMHAYGCAIINVYFDPLRIRQIFRELFETLHIPPKELIQSISEIEN